MSNPVLDPTPMGPPQAFTPGKAVGAPLSSTNFVKAGEVYKVVHYKDTLKCNHGGKVVLDPTEERNTEIKDDLRVVTDKDLLQKVTISGCSIKCTKIVSIPVGLARNVELKGEAVPVLSNIQAVTDKGCIVKFVEGGGFDVAKAVAALDKNAQPHSISRCAAYVKTALKAGGLPYIEAANADIFGTKIGNYGFSPVATNGTAGYTPQAGDVVVFPAVGTHTDGHTAMYDGSQWVSDFKQHNMNVWRDQSNPRYTIFRSNSASSGGGSGNQAHAGPR
jgi:hypothetical protein